MEQKQRTDGEWFVIANPVAGSGRVGKQWAALSHWLSTHLGRPELSLTQRSGHATELALQAIDAGYRRLLAVGGDGTCHEVVNGIFRQQAVPSTDIELALLPVGTGNDWIRTYGIPRKREAWLEMMRRGHNFLQDVGHIQYIDEQGRPAGRYFLNVAGIAFDAYVAREAARSSHRWLTAYYLMLILRHLMAFQPVAGRVLFDGQERVGRFITIEVGICRFVGGGMLLAPHAVPDDGRFALTIARDTSKIDILANIWRFFDGSIGRHSKIELQQAVDLQIDALTDSPLLVEADGEFLGQTPAKFRLLEKALKVVIPNPNPGV